MKTKKVRWHTDKEENQIFLIFKEIQSGAVTKSYMRKGFLIYEEMRKYSTIYEEAVSHWLCNCSILNFLIYKENLIFFFIRAEAKATASYSRSLSEVFTDCTVVTTCLPRVSYMCVWWLWSAVGNKPSQYYTCSLTVCRSTHVSSKTSSLAVRTWKD